MKLICVCVYMKLIYVCVHEIDLCVCVHEIDLCVCVCTWNWFVCVCIWNWFCTLNFHISTAYHSLVVRPKAWQFFWYGTWFLIFCGTRVASVWGAESLFSELQLFRLQMTDDLSIRPEHMYGAGNASANWSQCCSLAPELGAKSLWCRGLWQKGNQTTLQPVW